MRLNSEQEPINLGPNILKSIFSGSAYKNVVVAKCFVELLYGLDDKKCKNATKPIIDVYRLTVTVS